MTHNKYDDRGENKKTQWGVKSEEIRVTVDVKEGSSHKTKEVEISQRTSNCLDSSRSPISAMNPQPKGVNKMSLVACANEADQLLDLGTVSFSRAIATTFKVGNLELPSFTPEQIHFLHATNFQRLVRAVYRTEGELCRAKAIQNTQTAMQISSTTKKYHDSSKVHDTVARKSSRLQELNFTPEDNSLALNPIQNVDIERTSRNRRRNFNRYVGNLAEELTNFERAIFFPKNYGIGNSHNIKADDIMIFTNPMNWKNHLSKITESYSNNIMSEIKIEEYKHTIDSHVKDILKRSHDILMQWKKSLKVGDKISASDYMDEYECNNEDIGWTKLYEAVIKEVLSGPPESNSKGNERIYSNNELSSKQKVSTSSLFVNLGDSSSKHKFKRELRKGEKAILVHYIGYPKDEDRWLMINPKDEKIDGVIYPNHSQMVSFEALRKNSCIQSESSHPIVDDSNDHNSELGIKLGRLARKMLESKKQKKLEDKDWESMRSLYFQEFEIQQLKEKWCKILSTNHKTKDKFSNNINKMVKKLEEQNVSKSVSDTSKKSTVSKRKVELNGIIIKESNHKRLKHSQYFTSELENSESSHAKNSNQCHKSKNALRLSTSSKTPKYGNPTSKSNIKQKDDPELSFTWICVECREAECIADPESPLIVCEGLCNRPFHIPCAGLAKIPKSEETWICNDCHKRRHQCAVCHQYGEDDKEVFKCSKHNCGLFFHIACLNMYNVDVEIIDHSANLPYIENENDINEESEMDTMKKILKDNSQFSKQNTLDLKQHNRNGIKFKCPAHFCWTCSGGIPPTSTSDNNGKETTQEKLGNKKRIDGAVKSVSSLATITNAFKEKKGTLFRCLDCPNSFHATCIPPLCCFHELALLCHEHANSSKLPYLDINNSYQAEVERKADKKLEILRVSKSNIKNKLGLTLEGQRDNIYLTKNRQKRKEFLQGIKGDRITSSQKHLFKLLNIPQISNTPKNSLSSAFKFCLPCDFQKEVHSKPPTYIHTVSNRYDPSNRPKRHPPTNEVCQCKASPDSNAAPCDERCSNRMLGMECVGDLNKKIGGKNPYWNCNCGTDCGNRNLSSRMFPKCRPKREKGKGWGLVTVEGVKQGDIVQEYVGEVIDEKEKKVRLDSWTKHHPNDPNFYIMKLEHGWYIDARVKGSLSRFINHSCDPNCKLLPVNIAGFIRIAIVAIKNIAPDEFLSYDYQFDTKHGDKFICRCGAKGCRGTMKGGGSVTTTEETRVNSLKKTKKQLFVEAKARLERDKKFLHGIEKNERSRLYQTGMFVPGDSSNISETVASGPNTKDCLICTQSRVFLWRNALLGADFESRYSRMSVAKSLTNFGKKMNLASQPSTMPNVDVLSAIF